MPPKKEIAAVFRVLDRVFEQDVAEILRKYLFSLVFKTYHVFRIYATTYNDS